MQTATVQAAARETGSAFRKGALAMAPLLAAVVPFGLVVGATVARSSIDAGLGLSTATLLYGGSAQLAAIALVSSGAGVGTVVGTVVVINARLALYGAAMALFMAGQPRWFRWVGAYFIVDPQYVVVTTGLDAAVPLYLVGVLVPKLGAGSARTAALVAGLVAAAGSGLPAGTGLVLGIAAGMTAAVVAEGRSRS